MLTSKKMVKLIAGTQNKKVGKDFYDALDRQVNQMIILACTTTPKAILKADDVLGLEVVIRR